MTNPTPDRTWNPQDLPVLTDVVDVEAIPVLDIPAYDFSAELDALAQVLPEETQPELTLPDELSLDDVLGDEAGDSERASLNASQLIERLPSLDLEVDLPAELSLDDVLPGLDYGRSDPAMPSAARQEPVADDFAFELDDTPPAAAGTGGGNGLGALFARATFEPVMPASPAPAAAALAVVDASPLQADQVSLDQFAAQLDDFDEPADLPELPLDAFLNKADDASAPQAEVFAAESTEDEWAGTWEPPTVPAPDLAQLNEVPVLGAEPDTVEPASHPVPVLMDPQWDTSLAQSADVPDAANHASPDAAPGQPDAATAFEALPWDVPEQPAAVPADSFAMSIDDILAGLQPVAAPLAAVLPEDAAPVADSSAAVAEVATDAWQPSPVATPESTWRDEPVALAVRDDVAEAEPVAFVPAVPAAVAPEVAAWQGGEADLPASAPAQLAPADTIADLAEGTALEHTALVPPSQPDDTPLGRAVEPVPAWLQAAQAELAAPAAPAEPLARVTPAADSVQSISLDSLPTGVLGGGLGLATAAVSPAATLGEPAGKLPGGDWPLTGAGFHAGDKEVELAWARDLGAEPPLDLDQLPDAAEPAPVPVIAEVIRVRRQPAPAEELAAPAASAAVEQAVPVLSEDDIHIEAVSQAMPAQPGPAVAAPAVAAGLDEAALIEALYARVLPRMKVELALWMQDALEQQAKQLMAGVMKQLKEDFDMMLAESLRASLREALDEAASQNKDV